MSGDLHGERPLAVIVAVVSIVRMGLSLSVCLVPALADPLQRAAVAGTRQLAACHGTSEPSSTSPKWVMGTLPAGKRATISSVPPRAARQRRSVLTYRSVRRSRVAMAGGWTLQALREFLLGLGTGAGGHAAVYPRARLASWRHSGPGVRGHLGAERVNRVMSTHGKPSFYGPVFDLEPWHLAQVPGIARHHHQAPRPRGRRTLRPPRGIRPPGFALHNRDVVGIQQRRHAGAPGASGYGCASRKARPNAITSSKAGSSLHDPIIASSQFGLGARVARRR